MKLCINCYTENPDDVVFCSKCGMSLIGAPTGEEAVKLKELAAKPEAESRAQPQRTSSMFSVWLRAVTRPVLATYEELLQEEPNPTLSTAVGWTAMAGLISGAAAGLLNLLFGLAQGQSAGTLLAFWFLMLILVPVIGVISFVILSAMWLAIARAFGGQGDLGSQSYLLAAAQAPMSIVSASLSAIPYVGGLISSITGMYSLYLEVLALRAAHGLGWGKAAATVLIMIIILVAVSCTCAFFLMALGLIESSG